MKQRKRWLGLAAAPFVLAFLASAQPAQAADYTGDCTSIPNHVTGNATVNDTTCIIDTGATLIVDGTLTIDATSVDVKSEIQSVGKVTVRTTTGELKLRKKASSQNNDIVLQSPQNRIDTKGLEAGNSVQVDAGLNGAEGSTWDVMIDGQIIVNKVQSSPTNPDIHANVLLRAAGPISTKTIKTDGDLGPSSVKSGGVQIEAYRNGAGAANASEFVIGGTGNPNGVNGNIVTQSTIGGGTNPAFVNGGVYVTMGGRFNTGNIRVADMSAIKVRATQSRSGWIIFNANAGTIFLPAGNLNTSGDDTNNSGAGLIYMMANTLDTQPGTIISANQTETAAGTGHQIFIAVETLKYRGNGTDGLKILNDGNGGGGFFSLVNISPKGYLVPSNLTSNVNQMPWTFTLGSAELAFDGPLTIDGSEGNGQILLRADGNTAAVNVSGYPLAFNGGDVTVRSRGQTLHRINVGFFGTVNGTRQGLTVNNVGNWVLDANGKAPASGGAAAGGIIQVKADQTSLTALDSATDPSSGNIVIRANGDDTNGDGGIISVDTKSFVLGATTHAAIRADGAPNGSGNAINNPIDSAGPFAVILKTGSSDLIFGGGNRAIKVTANGGKTSGNGGTVKILPTNSKVTVRPSPAVDVSALGSSCTSCDAGNLQMIATEIQSNQGTSTDASLKANGSGNGTGGIVELKASGDITLNGRIEAAGGCQLGNGGKVTIDGLKVSTFNTIDASSSGADDGNGSGTCLAIAAATSLSAQLAPPGQDQAGDIIVKGNEWASSGLTKLVAKAHSNGNGGTIFVHNAIGVDLSNVNGVLLSARGAQNGSGGRVSIDKTSATFTVNKVIEVDSGDGAQPEVFGGSISLNGIEAVRHKTGKTSWPRVVWINPDDMSTTVQQVVDAAFNLPPGMKSIFESEKVNLFVFPLSSTYQTFFTDSSLTEEAGFVTLGYTKFEFRRVSVYLQINPIHETTTVHELGHALDRSQNLSLQLSFTDAIAQQAQDFNSVPCEAAFDGTPWKNDCGGKYTTNWALFSDKVMNNASEHEIFAQFFSYKGAREKGYGFIADRAVVFSRCAVLNEYMDHLWPLYP